MKETTNALPVNQDWKSEAGPLKPYLNDPTVSEIMVNRWDKIFLEKNGVIQECEYKFQNAEALMRFVQALAVSCGREINRRQPYLDARLSDGSRLNMIVPPLAIEGPSITIRKTFNQEITYEDLIQKGALDEKAVYFLHQAVLAKQNIVISGGTGSGKTTLLNVLSSFIGETERVVCLEDTAELQIHVKNLVRLETKPALGNEPAISMGELLKNALRMRPDRIVVGECRGAEAVDMLMAMNTGHEGSLTTVHANTAGDALRRMESMILRSGMEAPLSMIQTDIATTIDLVIQVERSMDGKRRVVEILEVCGRENGAYITRNIFKYENLIGLVSTGIVPSFVSKNESGKINLPANFFNPEQKIKLSA